MNTLALEWDRFYRVSCDVGFKLDIAQKFFKYVYYLNFPDLHGQNATRG